ELGEDFTYYFANSEQTPSSVGLGVLVNPDNTILAAGGFIIQLMPGASDEVISEIDKITLSSPPVSKLINDGLSPQEMLQQYIGTDNVTILDTLPVQFRCTCSKERFANAIISLGKQEIQEMIDEDGKADAQCHFCNRSYHYTKEELEELKGEATQ